MEDRSKTFKDLGLIEELCEACDKMGWKEPTPIQKEAIPVALQGSDVIGLAETGSGKTAAFGLPILQALLLKPQTMFALILTPTRELAVQIKEQLDDLGRDVGLSCLAVVGGIDMAKQAVMLLKKPHIIIATLGRLADHLKHLKGFSLNSIKYLVMDEADRILNMDFEEEVDAVIRSLPQQRTTMLFSATITNKVRELQRAHLRKAVKVEVNSSFKLVDSLTQYMISMPFIDRHVYLEYLLNSFSQKSVLVFCNTRPNTIKTALILRQCGHTAIPLYGDMSQGKRQDALTKFKQKERSILVATNVASRGLDIPCVDYVINLEVPSKSEDYIHRVGRTARAGRSGTAITFVTQFEIEDFIRIEHVVMQDAEVKRIPLYPIDKEDLKKFTDKISEAEVAAKKEMRRIDDIRRANRSDRGGQSDEDDTEEASGVRKRLKRDDSQQHGGRGQTKHKNKKSMRGRRR